MRVCNWWLSLPWNFNLQLVVFDYGSPTRRHGLHSQNVLQPQRRACFLRPSSTLAVFMFSWPREWGCSLGQAFPLKSLPSFPKQHLPPLLFGHHSRAGLANIPVTIGGEQGGEVDQIVDM